MFIIRYTSPIIRIIAKVMCVTDLKNIAILWPENWSDYKIESCFSRNTKTFLMRILILKYG